MAKLTAKEGGIEMEPGTYGVIVRAVEDVDGQYGQQVKLELEVEEEEDENGDPIKLPVWASAKLTPLSKLWSWFEAFGIKPEMDTEYDTQVLKGKRAQALIVDTTTKTGGKTSKIDSLFPAGKTRRNGPAAPEGTPLTELTVEQWWALTRERKHERKAVMALSQSMFDCEPSALTEEERVELLDALDKAPDKETVPFS